jgi:hypothetical protein
MDTVKDYLRWADKRPRPVVHDKEGTVHGGIETVIWILLVITLFILFVVQLFNSQVTTTDQPPSENQINALDFICTSHTGCNVTYDFDAGGPCQSLTNIAPRTYNESEIMTLNLCWDSRRFSAGVIVTAAVDINVQWEPPREKFHIAELIQPGKVPIPLIPLLDQRAQIVRFIKRTDKEALSFEDSFSFVEKLTTLGFQWDMTAPGNAGPDTTCQQDFAFPFICGSMVLQPSEFFLERITRYSSSWTLVITRLASIITLILFLSGLFVKYVLKDGVYVMERDLESASETEMTSL